MKQSRIMLRQNGLRLSLSCKCNTVRIFPGLSRGKMERERKRCKQCGYVIYQIFFISCAENCEL